MRNHGITPARDEERDSQIGVASSGDAEGAIGDDSELVEVRQRIGTTLCEKWRITELLGMGGMSIVYAAEHRNGRPVAIKMMRAVHATNSSIVDRFLSEGYVANRIGHPAIVQILDDDCAEDGSPFLVMERLHGESMDRRFRRGPLSPQEVLLIAERTLDALTAAHAAGVLHRDIKPENLMIVNEREVKLLDFGIARCRELQTGKGTAMGQVMGTPAYMAPEQARGQWNKVDERSDLFSLSATLFVLATGREARPAETTNLQLFAAMSEPFPKVETVLADVPDVLAKIIDRGLMIDPSARFQTAAEMHEAVRSALLEIGPARETGTPLSRTNRTIAQATLLGVAPVRATASSVRPIPIAEAQVHEGPPGGSPTVDALPLGGSMEAAGLERADSSVDGDWARIVRNRRRPSRSLLLVLGAAAVGVGVWAMSRRTEEPAYGKVVGRLPESSSSVTAPPAPGPSDTEPTEPLSTASTPPIAVPPIAVPPIAAPPITVAHVASARGPSGAGGRPQASVSSNARTAVPRFALGAGPTGVSGPAARPLIVGGQAAPAAPAAPAPAQRHRAPSEDPLERRY